MFALRGLAITLSVFAIAYVLLSLTICLTWRRIRHLSPQQSIQSFADILFAVRILPLTAAVLVTVILAAPSFWLLEPREIVEPIGGFSLTLGACGLMILTFGFLNTLLALRKASRTISRWVTGAQRVPSIDPVPVLRIPCARPPMAAVGIFRSAILFSDAAQFALEPGEMRSALNHEMAHVRSHDNLKKLLLHFVAIPAIREMRELERAWLEASEMAADHAAVSSINEALDLAAAVIKLCQMALPQLSVQLGVASFAHSSADIVNERIERLIHWTEEPRSNRKHFYRYSAGLALGLIVVLGISYSQLLIGIHVATEWLMR